MDLINFVTHQNKSFGNYSILCQAEALGHVARFILDHTSCPVLLVLPASTPQFTPSM